MKRMEMIAYSPIRTLFSRDHETVLARKGVFLAGPTPPDGQMQSGWRRAITNRLLVDERLNASMIVVSPEPEAGYWSAIDRPDPQTQLELIRDKQMPWELQYLKLCDITAFWLPTYWEEGQSGDYAPNIGPTSRFEFGFFLQEYLNNPRQRRFIIGAPEDAESVKWARKICAMHGIRWHSLPVSEKHKLVADSFIEEITASLLEGEWRF